MLDGLVDERGLLAPLLCRVSAEYAVVAAAARGLLRLLAPRVEWNVRLEAKNRTDVLVERTGEAVEEWAFEFKMLWERGFKQNIRGITSDLRKVRALRRGCAIACAFAVQRAPPRHQNFETRESLESTVSRAVDGVGAPLRVSRDILVHDNDVDASLRLIAWR